MEEDINTIYKKREEWKRTFLSYESNNEIGLDKSTFIKRYEPPISRNFEFLINSLSKPMKVGLKNIIEQKDNIPLSTFNALIKRNLVHAKDRQLTEQDRIIAISLLSLEKQCENLDLILKKISDFEYSNKKTEEGLLFLYKKRGYSGFYSEGYLIFEIIKVLIMCTLYDKSIPYFKFEDELKMKFLGFTILNEKFSELTYSEIVKTIEEASIDSFCKYFEKNKLIQKQSTFNLLGGEINIGKPEFFKEYDLNDTVEFLKVFGRKNLSNIFEI